MSEGSKRDIDDAQGGGFTSELSTPTSIDPHIRDRLYSLNSGAKLSPYLSTPENPIHMEAARRVVAQDLIEIDPEIEEIKRDLSEAQSLVSKTPNEEEEKMSLYIGNLQRMLERSLDSKGRLSGFHNELSYGIKSLPEEKFKTLMDAVEIEASIIEKVAMGRAIIRHLNEIGTLSDTQKVIDEATEYVLDHLDGALKEQPDEATLLFEDEIKNLYQKIKSGGITPTSDDYIMAEQIFERWVLESAINRAGAGKEGIGDDASLALTDPIAQVARGMSDID